jgi:hypothetical protein
MIIERYPVLEIGIDAMFANRSEDSINPTMAPFTCPSEVTVATVALFCSSM